jgi:hypothetical protein
VEDVPAAVGVGAATEADAAVAIVAEATTAVGAIEIKDRK